MIPRAYITAWRSQVPWVDDAQVEQDLVLSRAIVEIYSDPILRKELAFRGGTALHKLFFHPPGRYSEDLDFVRTSAGPAGPLIDRLRSKLDPWLGEPRRKRNDGRVTLYYVFETEIEPIRKMRVKVEINVREHFHLLERKTIPFTVASPWHTGTASVNTFEIEELLGTKLRALYQRKKGRDLYDLQQALAQIKSLDTEKIVQCFYFYLGKDKLHVSRDEFEQNLLHKENNLAFRDDILPLLTTTARNQFSFDEALATVRQRIIAQMPESRSVQKRKVLKGKRQS